MLHTFHMCVFVYSLSLQWPFHESISITNRSLSIILFLVFKTCVQNVSRVPVERNQQLSLNSQPAVIMNSPVLLFCSYQYVYLLFMCARAFSHQKEYMYVTSFPSLYNSFLDLNQQFALYIDKSYACTKKYLTVNSPYMIQ